jgi:hypothetical protein
MSDIERRACPNCDPGPERGDGVDRRRFLQLVGGGATAPAVASAAPQLRAGEPAAAQPAPDGAALPAEALVQELFAGLSAAQRQHVVLPWNHVAQGRQVPTRLRMTDVPCIRQGYLHKKPVEGPAWT